MCFSNAVNINKHIDGLLRGMVARKPQIYQQWLLYLNLNSQYFLLGYKICSSTLPSTPNVYKCYTYAIMYIQKKYANVCPFIAPIKSHLCHHDIFLKNNIRSKWATPAFRSVSGLSPGSRHRSASTPSAFESLCE